MEKSEIPSFAKRERMSEMKGQNMKTYLWNISFFKRENSYKPYRVKDIVYGDYYYKWGEADFIIVKRDRFPTYHFASVVDDHHMEISGNSQNNSYKNFDKTN